MRKLIPLFVLLFILLLAPTVYAIDVIIDNEFVMFDKSTGAPFIDASGRTQVPLRATMEAYGTDVAWDNINKIATVSKDGTEVKIKIGEKFITRNGAQVPIDTAAMIKDGRTYLPIRAVLESFGASVGWDAKNNKVMIGKSRDYAALTLYPELAGTEWQTAMSYYDYDAVRELFTTKYNINEPNAAGTYPLEMSVVSFSNDMTKFLIGLGADVNQIDFQGNSVLKTAYDSNPSVVNMLIGAGATYAGKTPATTATTTDADGFTDATRPKPYTVQPDEIDNVADFKDYLEYHLEDFDTPMGEVSFNFGDIEIYDDTTRDRGIYFWIRLVPMVEYHTPGGNIQLLTFSQILDGGTFSDEEQQETIDALKKTSKEIAGYAKEAFPDGTIFCSYVDDGYKYPNLKVGYSSSNYFSWKMVDGDLTWYDLDADTEVDEDYFDFQ